MNDKKYVELSHVQELLKLIKTRDSFHDWSNEYEKYDKKVKNTIEWLERNAKELTTAERNYIGFLAKYELEDLRKNGVDEDYIEIELCKSILEKFKN